MTHFRMPSLRSLDPRARMLLFLLLAAVVSLLGTPIDALAHGVAAGDKGYIQESKPIQRSARSEASHLRMSADVAERIGDGRGRFSRPSSPTP